MAKWRRLLLPAALLAAVIALGLWYTRPLDLYGLGLEQTPDDISVTIRRSEGGTADSAQRSLRLVRREAGFDSLLQQLEGLSFRRSPLEPLLRVVPGLAELGSQSAAVEGQAYQIIVSLAAGESGSWDFTLQYSPHGWRYGTQGRPAELPLYPAGPDPALALGDALWALAAE